jgi:YgiT-type zinc finger domain-containing protein
MMPFEKCPVCGGEVVEKEVEKLLKGGVNMAVMKATADVCHKCGEQLYTQKTVQCFERIRDKLKRDDVAGFDPIGQSYQIPNCRLESPLQS